MVSRSKYYHGFWQLGMLLLVLFVLAESSNAGTVIARHSGDTDPEALPSPDTWTKRQANASGQSVGPINDPGYDAWMVSDLGTPGGASTNYARFPTSAQVSQANTNGWTLRTTLRVPGGADGPGLDAVDDGVSAVFRNGTKQWRLMHGLVGGDTAVQLTAQQTQQYTIPGSGTTTYNDFELVYNPRTANAALFVNGTDPFLPDSGGTLSWTPEVYFGANISNGKGIGYYNLAEFEINDAPPPVRHVGSTNPLNEGWTFTQNNAGYTTGPGNDTEPHWRLQQIAGAYANYASPMTADDFSDPEGWTATGRMKLNAGDVKYQAQFSVDDGQHRWSLQMIDGTGSAARGVYTINTVNNLSGPLSTANPTDGYHTYQMVHDPDGDGGNGITYYYLDGVGIGTQTRAATLNSSAESFRFGDWISGGPASDSQWSLLQHEKGQTAMTGTVIEHRGTNDPTTEGFIHNAGGTEGASSDGLAWQVTAANGSTNSYQIVPDASTYHHPKGWTATATVKLNDAASSVNSTLWIEDGQDIWSLHLVGGPNSSQTGVFGMAQNFELGDLFSSIDPTADYHTYRIVYDPEGDGGLGMATYWLDGGVIARQTRADVVDRTTYSRFMFGDIKSAGGPSDSQWALVRFETGQFVPEPSTLAIMAGLGGFLALLVRRRRRGEA